MSHRTYYELFGVSPDTDVSLIRAAYRRLIRTYHPDIAGKSGEWMTHELNAALDIFCDPIKRAAYDRALEDSSIEAGQQLGGSSFPTDAPDQVDLGERSDSHPRCRQTQLWAGIGFVMIAALIGLVHSTEAFVPTGEFVWYCIVFISGMIYIVAPRGRLILLPVGVITIVAFIGIRGVETLDTSWPMLAGELAFSFASLLVGRYLHRRRLFRSTVRKASEWAAFLMEGSRLQKGRVCSITDASLTSDGQRTDVVLRSQTTGALESVCLWGQYFVGEWVLVGEGCEKSIVFAVGDSKAAEAYEVLKTYPIKAARH